MVRTRDNRRRVDGCDSEEKGAGTAVPDYRGIEQGPRVIFGNEDFKRATTPTPISSRVRSQGFFSPLYLPQCQLPPHSSS